MTSRNLLPLTLGLLATLCMLGASMAGIASDFVYARETVSWRAQGTGQDWANLLVVLPALLITTWLAARGSHTALHVWRGLLLYVLYSYLLYAFFIHFNRVFLLYVGALAFSFWSLVSSLLRHRVQLRDPLPRARFAASVLMFSAALFALMWLSQIIPANITNTEPGGLLDAGLIVNPVHVLDLAFVLPAMVIAATLLRARRPLGYLLAPPILVFSVVMGLAIEFMFYFQARQGVEIVVSAAVVVGLVVLLSLWSLVSLIGRTVTART